MCHSLCPAKIQAGQRSGHHLHSAMTTPTPPQPRGIARRLVAGRCDELHAGDTAAAMLCKLRSAARPVELGP